MTGQWLAVALVGALSIAIFALGVLAGTGRWKLVAVRGILPGVVPGSVLAGIGGLLFTVEVAFAVATDNATRGPFARWWFAGPPVPADALDSLLGSPSLAFLIVGLAIVRWGAPSLSETSALLRQLSDPERRSHARRVLLDIPIIAVGAVVGGLAAGMLLAPGLSVSGALLGGILAWRLFGYDERSEERRRG